jgi:hypothetical protein
MLKNAKDIGKELQAYAKFSTSEHLKRKQAAEKDSHIHIAANGVIHDPVYIEGQLLNRFAEVNITNVLQVICLPCTTLCKHRKSIHIILNISGETEDKADPDFIFN